VQISIKAALLAAAPIAMTAAALPAAAQQEGPAFIQEWKGPFEGVPPWDKVKVSDLPAAFQVAMDETKAEFEAMLTSSEPITFDNTITATELGGKKVDRLFSIYGVHASNLSNPELRKIQGEWLPNIFSGSSIFMTSAPPLASMQNRRVFWNEPMTIWFRAVLC